MYFRLESIYLCVLMHVFPVGIYISVCNTHILIKFHQSTIVTLSQWFTHSSIALMCCVLWDCFYLECSLWLKLMILSMNPSVCWTDKIIYIYIYIYAWMMYFSSLVLLVWAYFLLLSLLFLHYIYHHPANVWFFKYFFLLNFILLSFNY